MIFAHVYRLEGCGIVHEDSKQQLLAFSQRGIDITFTDNIISEDLSQSGDKELTTANGDLTHEGNISTCMSHVDTFLNCA